MWALFLQQGIPKTEDQMISGNTYRSLNIHIYLYTLRKTKTCLLKPYCTIHALQVAMFLEYLWSLRSVAHSSYCSSVPGGAH